MRISRLLFAVAVLLVGGCSGKPSSGAIQVQVVLAPGLQSACVRVEVTAANGGAPLESGPIVLAGKSSPLVVGIAPTGQEQPVTVQAIGYSDPGCNSRTVPAEVSDTAQGSFTTPVTVLTVTLAPASTDGGTDGGSDAGTDAGVDLDNDGYSPPDDCDDTNPLIKPGVQELCVDHLDNNCDALTDCADPMCGGQACVAGGGAVCSMSTCKESACGDNADNDGDGMTDCADADCQGQACGVGGTCVGVMCVAPNETNLCGDGVDNDNDTLIDCLDPDCPAGAMCSDVNACTMMDVCGTDGGCVAGAPKVCDMPPNTRCWSLAGTCLPDAGGACEYTLNSGSACDDGRACTRTDTCDLDGGCAGTPVVCDQSPGQCFAMMGTCSEALDGGCVYPPLVTGSCTDGDNCTVNDTCDGDGGCVGSAVSCAPAGVCEARNGCDADGGCLYRATPGAACDAGMGAPGTCADAGVCNANPVIFPFTPSNFTEAQLPANAGALTFGCGTTGLNTGAAGGASLVWTNNCAGNTASPAFTEVTIGAQRAVLLFAESLTVNGSSTLQVTGSRALIIAVRNAATISGTIDVGSTVGRTGPGADLGCGSAAGSVGGQGTGSGSSIAGGGGGGAFGTDGGVGAQGENGTAGGAGGALLVGSEALVPLRGGCPGGNGGRAGSPDGQGGRGGGAVQLTVGGALTVNATGRVTAYGQGGRGGLNTGGTGASTRGGGGGGGSGGGVLLEAATLTINASAAITANGGGGGQAAGGSTGADGANGAAATATPAAGGTSGTCGGSGGAGAAGTTGASAGSQASCSNGDSGGGGGGGVGRIVLRASTSCTINGTAIVSPPARGNGTGGCPAP